MRMQKAEILFLRAVEEYRIEIVKAISSLGKDLE
jgi:hypothetical protein